jgi:hypothetical protein
MVKTALVESEIEDGRKFLELMSEEGLPVKAAMWRRGESPGYWSLLLVTPLLDEIGMIETFRRVRDILWKSPGHTKIEIGDITPLSPKSRFAKSMRKQLGTLRDYPIVGWPVGDQFIEDGYLYFAK